jgi:hypothetical protein
MVRCWRENGHPCNRFHSDQERKGVRGKMEKREKRERMELKGTRNISEKVNWERRQGL